MRFVQIGFGIFMISGATALGCGGSDNANPPPGGTGGKGGSAGSGGAAGSATAGKGGAGTGGSSGSGTTGGTGGMATGGTGGMTTGGGAGMTTGGGAGMATGGGAGMPGSGGEGGGNGAECPGTAPEDESECDPDVNPGFMDDPCVYGDVECTCAGFGGGDPSWSCEGGPTTTECPMAAPEDGSECDPDVNPGFMDDPCVFGDTECTCAGGGGGGMAEWNCTMAAMCPMDAPDDGDMCDGDTDPGPMDGGCQYDTTTCVCAGGGGGGMQTWNCGTCPDMAPEDEDTCDNEVNGFCAYESGNCTCNMMDEWNCMN
jgi:hypothetical protein